MASFAFITLYDHFSIGIRIMSSVLRNAGHQSSILYLKIPRGCLIDTPSPKQLGYEFMYDSDLYEVVDSKVPWSDTEEDLVIKWLDCIAPDVICLSTRSIFDEVSQPLLKRIKNHFKDKPLIAGGYGPTLAPEIYLDHADYVAFGEGEETILDIAVAIDSGQSLAPIPNLIFKQDQRLVRNPVRQPAENLDQYPFPDYDNPEICYINDNQLYEKDPATSANYYPVLMGRGCVGTCSYCSAGQWTQLYKDNRQRVRSRRLRSIDHTIKELKMVKNLGAEKIMFVDSYLAGPKAYMLEFFNRYEQEIGLPFNAHPHEGQMVQSPEILDAACQAGLFRVVLGIQHGNETFRNTYLHRNVRNSTIIKAAKIYQERGLDIEYHIIAGTPFETPQTLLDSFDFVAGLPKRYGNLAVNRLRVFPNSPIERQISETKSNVDKGPINWYFTGALYYLRRIIDGDDFNEKFSPTIALLFQKESPTLHHQLISTFFSRLFKEFERTNSAGKPIASDWHLDGFVKYLLATFENYQTNGKPEAAGGMSKNDRDPLLETIVDNVVQMLKLTTMQQRKETDITPIIIDDRYDALLRRLPNRFYDLLFSTLKKDNCEIDAGTNCAKFVLQKNEASKDI